MASILSARRQARRASIERYLQSGLTQRQFCEREQINYATFHYWLKKYRQEKATPGQDDQPMPNFVPLRFAAPESSAPDRHYTIEFTNGVTLHIHCPIDPHLLTQLIRAQDS